MTTITTEKIEELRRVTLAATPGEWEYRRIDEDSKEWTACEIIGCGNFVSTMVCTEQDAEFIAAANPATIGALLDLAQRAMVPQPQEFDSRYAELEREHLGDADEGTGIYHPDNRAPQPQGQALPELPEGRSAIALCDEYGSAVTAFTADDMHAYARASQLALPAGPGPSDEQIKSAIRELDDCEAFDDGGVTEDAVAIIRKLFSHSLTQMKIMEGETYIGVIGNAQGEVYHIVLLPEDSDPASHDEQLAWAQSLGGDLPTRAEQAMLFANNKALFHETWYWSNQLDGYGGAWHQDFEYGHQKRFQTGYALRARAVRRVLSSPAVAQPVANEREASCEMTPEQMTAYAQSVANRRAEIYKTQDEQAWKLLRELAACTRADPGRGRSYEGTRTTVNTKADLMQRVDAALAARAALCPPAEEGGKS